MRSTLPAGVVTFLFTDIEGSTRLAHDLGTAWPGVLQAHHQVLRAVFPGYGGVEVSTAGDSFFVAFASASDAIAAAVAMQRAIANHDWDPHPPIRVRMGLHTGEATQHDNDYAGLTVHAASRVESAASGGQVLLTAATSDAATLPDGVDLLDLGMHRLKDLPTEVHLFQVLAGDLDRDFPPVRGLDVLRSNLPVPLSTFIGRADALASVHRLLDADRLITLFGPGGTGKTRLSLKLASERTHRYRDGAWFVELDPARDEATVAAAVAGALGVREQPGRSLIDELVEHLRPMNVLLVVDNCEHVIDAAAAVIEKLLRAGDGVRVLATSREPLAITGERVWPVPPLSTDGDEPEAMALLIDRVRLLQPDFELNGDRPAALAICRELDGLPLALELAAASTSVLTLDDIAIQLMDRFAVLTRGSRTALDRQKTLWGAIDWSYDLLDQDDQLFFTRLGVFPGEFDTESAVAVCEPGDTDATARIARLTSKSLVTVTPAGRYRLLESIRAYTRERLAQRGDAEHFFERHARWFADGLLHPDGGPSWARQPDGFDLVHDDLVASLLWATATDRRLALDLLAQLQLFWARRSRWAEGRALSARVLDATSGTESTSRYIGLAQAAQLALMQTDLPAARTLFEQAVEVQRAIGGDQLAQVAMGDLGLIAEAQGDFDTAEVLFEQTLAGARSLSMASEALRALSHLAELARRRGDLDLALDRGAAALEAAQAAGADADALHIENLLGDVARQQGDTETARRYYERATKRAQAAGEDGAMIYLMYCLASVALDDGELDDAAPLLADAIGRGRDAEAPADLAESLEATARLAAIRGERAPAAQLLGTVDAIREAIGYPRSPADLPAYEALLALIGDDAAQMQVGRDASIEDAIVAALNLLAR